jgi:hypothetical protein
LVAASSVLVAVGISRTLGLLLLLLDDAAAAMILDLCVVLVHIGLLIIIYNVF